MSSVSGNRPIQVTTTDVKPMFGKPKTKITLAREGKTTAILGRAVTDLNDTKVQKKLESRKYVLLKIEDKIYLVKIDNIRKSLYTSEASVAKGRGLAPTDTMAVVRESMEKAAVDKAAPHQAGAPAIATGDDLLRRLEQEANLAATGMTSKEAQAIINAATDIKAGKITPGGKKYVPGESMYVKKSKVKPHLKCSLNILANGDICVLVKTKKKGILPAFIMKFGGTFKTVKGAVNLQIGEVLAHSVLNVTKEAEERFASLRSNPTDPMTRKQCGYGPTEPIDFRLKGSILRRIENAIIKEVHQECAHQSRFSPQIAIDPKNIITYETEDKEHNITRKVSFPCSKAAGDAKHLAKSPQMTNILYNPEELQRNLVGLTTSLVEVHKAGLVYRDAKPENILILEEKNPDGSPQLDKNNRPKTTLVRIDYGLAESAAECTGSTAGSLTSIAPDVATGASNADFYKADMWSEAASMLELLTGSTTNFNQYLLSTKNPNKTFCDQLLQSTVDDAFQKMKGAGYSDNLAHLYANQFDSKKCLTSAQFLVSLESLSENDFKKR